MTKTGEQFRVVRVLTPKRKDSPTDPDGYYGVEFGFKTTDSLDVILETVLKYIERVGHEPSKCRIEPELIPF